jgi:hypothetical protein
MRGVASSHRFHHHARIVAAQCPLQGRTAAWLGFDVEANNVQPLNQSDLAHVPYSHTRGLPLSRRRRATLSTPKKLLRLHAN